MAVPDDWVERAQYDLDTAKAMLDARRYLYVLFCCQQAVEKAIKAVIALRTGSLPPRLHNLTSLAEKAGLEVTEQRAEQFRLLTNFYIQSRYPEQVKALARDVDRERAGTCVRFTEELLEWLWTLMK